MKKLIFSLVVMTFFSVENVFADWSNAKYFQCAITKRYTARAKLKPPTQNTYSWTYDGGCGYASTNISSYAVNNTSNCGYAQSFRNSGGGSGSGWSQCGWKHGEDVDFLPSFFNFAPMKAIGIQKSENDENYTYSGLADNGIEFNESNRTISIDNLNGKLLVRSLDIFNSYSTFQVEIYTFEIINGEPVKSTSLWKAKASIINGKLFIEGNFNQTEFQDRRNGNNYEYGIQGVRKQYVLPDNINIESVCVEVSGDGGNLGGGISPKYAPNLDSEEGRIFTDNLKENVKFDFNVLLKDGFVTGFVTTNNFEKVINEVSILSLSGQVLKTTKVDIARAEMTIDVSDLSSGVYLFMMKSGEEYYSKKFFK